MTQTKRVGTEQENTIAQLVRHPRIKALIDKAREQQQLPHKEFLAALPEDEFDENQVDAVYRHLIEMGVQIVTQDEDQGTDPQATELAKIEIETKDEPPPMVEVATGELTGDPVRMYLREIGRVPLLHSVKEMWLAMRISAAGYVVTVLQETDQTQRTKAQKQALREWLARLDSCAPSAARSCSTVTTSKTRTYPPFRSMP